jgi:DNA-3-methyladenine glycosylase II
MIAMNNLIKLKPKAPFNFELCGQIFSHGHPQIRRYEGGSFWQLVRLERYLSLISLESSGTIDNPELNLKIESELEFNGTDLKNVSRTVSHIFNLRLDLNKFYNDLGEDGVIEKIVKRLRGLKSPLTPTIFEALVDSIIEQQISLQVAHTLQNRVIKRFGDSLEINGTTFYTYPSPEKICNITLQELRDCGLTFRKAEYILGLSRDMVRDEIDLEDMKKISETSDLLDELIKIRGVGIWTAELTVLRSLGRYDAIPGDDIALRRIMSHFYQNGKAVSPSEAREIATKWGDWMGLAGYYLEVAEMLKIKV